ncbi:NAD(P)-dependent dehydrogenase (short-subunit alcohol dehydrogenase family) [Paraburkholderia sp. GAS41]
MHRLTGKVAIVTGASAGIGRAAARLFAAKGAKIVVAARREAELDALVAEIARDGGRLFRWQEMCNPKHSPRRWSPSPSAASASRHRVQQCGHAR